MTPQAAARLTEQQTALPDAPGDRVAGYGVMGIPFASGDYLALRAWTRSSFGDPYHSLWHRDAAGRWTVYADAPPETSCARFLRPAISAARTMPIDIDWPDAHTLVVNVPDAALTWTATLTRTPVTRLLSTMAPAMPRWTWRSDAALRVVGAASAGMLRVGRLRLAGTMPNGQHYQLAPQLMWAVKGSTASIGGRVLEAPQPARPQASIGEVPLPQHGVFFAASTARFTDPTREPRLAGSRR